VAIASSSTPGDVVVPLRTVGGKVPLVSQVRSTLIASSVLTLRGRGLFDQYIGKLAKEMHDPVLEAVAGSWMPLAVGLAHYAATDALGLSMLEQFNIGREVAERVQNSVLATLVRAAKTVGVTPWTGLEQFQRMWDRMLVGGSGAVYRLGPKEARVEAHGNPLVARSYFRNSWRGMFAGSGELFCRKLYVTEVSAPKAETPLAPFVMRIAWA